MSHDLIKAVARRFGLYRRARWVNRHVLNRAELRSFRAQCEFYGPFVQPGDLCFDVGANYGFKTEVFLALGGRVVAFEPQHDCWLEIRARNPTAIALETAVGAATGTLSLYVDPHRTGSSAVEGWRKTANRSITVPVTTLDAAIDQYGIPQFCKIDVEGFEVDVLQGLTHPIPVMSFEFHQHRIPAARTCLEYLSRFGACELNITPEEQPVFLSASWLSPGEMLTFLESEVSRRPDCQWGDVFVRRLLA